MRGDARIWAAGAIYAVGQVNFLFDRSQTPHVTAKQLTEALGVVQTTMANKAGIINRALGIGMFEPDLTRVATIEQHPMAWLVEVDGFILDARTLPPELQGRSSPTRADPRPRRTACRMTTAAELDALIDEVTVETPTTRRSSSEVSMSALRKRSFAGSGR